MEEWVHKDTRLPDKQEDGDAVIVYNEEFGQQLVNTDIARAWLDEEFMGTFFWKKLGPDPIPMEVTNV